MKIVDYDIYDRSFYDRISIWSLQSANVIVPIIIELAQPKSVIDVGCGDGTWLQVFHDHGVTDIFGIDGPHIQKDLLKISTEAFSSQDLNQPVHLSRKFDVAICLEVAEHLRAESADILVNSLVALSEIIVFSAAIPLQPGEQHINPHWPEYWVSLFSQRGYVLINCLRYKIWNEPNVAFFYKQNSLIFVKQSKISELDTFKGAIEKYSRLPISIVHPELINLISHEIANISTKKIITNFLIPKIKRRFRRTGNPNAG